MRFSCYDWNPKRFNPQFNGIANRYSSHKKQRLLQEQNRKELDSDYAYTTKLDNTLEKALQSKTLQLCRLQQVKRRHLDDIQFKQQLFEQRMRQIENLKERNAKNRSQIRNKIENARQNLYSKNISSRIKMKKDLSKMSDRLEHLLQQRHRENSIKRNTIKETQIIGLERVNDFHRRRNQKSVMYYMEKIREENRLKKEQKLRIKRYQKQMKLMNKTVEAKKAYLNELEDEIQNIKSNVKTFESGNSIKKKKSTQGSSTIKVRLKSQNFDDSYLNPEKTLNNDGLQPK